MVKEEDLVANKVPREWVLLENFKSPICDFPSEDKKESKELLVGAYRAESTKQCTERSGITTKTPPLFDGSTSWLIEDWLRLTVLEETERGPALKNRLVGDAEM